MEAVRKTAYGKQLAQILGSYKVDDSTAEDRLYDKRGAAQAAYQAKKHWWNPGGGFSGVQRRTLADLQGLHGGKRDFDIEFVTNKEWGNNVVAVRLTPQSGGNPLFLPLSPIENGRMTISPTGRVQENDILFSGKHYYS